MNSESLLQYYARMSLKNGPDYFGIACFPRDLWMKIAESTTHSEAFSEFCNHKIISTVHDNGHTRDGGFVWVKFLLPSRPDISRNVAVMFGFMVPVLDPKTAKQEDYEFILDVAENMSP